MKQPRFPPGWNVKKVREVIAHYENQTEDEAVAEDEAAFSDSSCTTMSVPRELVPLVDALIAKHQTAIRKLPRTKAPSRKRKRA